MKARSKVMVLVMTAILLLIFGLGHQVLRWMSIEDHYGDGQELYSIAKSGDVLINRTRHEVGRLYKTDTRIYVIQSGDTQDVYSLLERNALEVVRLKIAIDPRENPSEAFCDRLLKNHMAHSVFHYTPDRP